MIAVLLAVTAMYSIQGCIYGLSDRTLPHLLNRKESSLGASEVLAIVHLPAALKVFFAPLVDYGAQNIPGGNRFLRGPDQRCWGPCPCAKCMLLALTVG